MMPFRGPAGTKSLLNPQAPVVHPSDPRSRGHKPTSLKMGVPATDRATEWPPLSTAEKQSCERVRLSLPQDASHLCLPVASTSALPPILRKDPLQAFLKAPRSAQGIATDLAVQVMASDAFPASCEVNPVSPSCLLLFPVGKAGAGRRLNRCRSARGVVGHR